MEKTRPRPKMFLDGFIFEPRPDVQFRVVRGADLDSKPIRLSIRRERRSVFVVSGHDSPWLVQLQDHLKLHC